MTFGVSNMIQYKDKYRRTLMEHYLLSKKWHLEFTTKSGSQYFVPNDKTKKIRVRLSDHLIPQCRENHVNNLEIIFNKGKIRMHSDQAYWGCKTFSEAKQYIRCLGFLYNNIYTTTIDKSKNAKPIQQMVCSDKKLSKRLAHLQRKYDSLKETVDLRIQRANDCSERYADAKKEIERLNALIACYENKIEELSA